MAIMKMNNSNNNNFEYDSSNIKIFFTQGIIPNIFSQLLNSFEDSYGIFLGKYKKLKIEKSLDANSNVQENQINIIINKVIFIFDKNYFSQNEIKKVINTMEENEPEHSILGILSIRKFSSPLISAKDQSIFFCLRNIMKKNLPFFFGAFTFNPRKPNEENGVKMSSFESKMFYFDNNL